MGWRLFRIGYIVYLPSDNVCGSKRVRQLFRIDSQLPVGCHGFRHGAWDRYIQHGRYFMCYQWLNQFGHVCCLHCYGDPGDSDRHTRNRLRILWLGRRMQRHANHMHGGDVCSTERDCNIFPLLANGYRRRNR
jgi:hypothetical protein